VAAAAAMGCTRHPDARVLQPVPWFWEAIQRIVKFGCEMLSWFAHVPSKIVTRGEPSRKGTLEGPTCGVGGAGEGSSQDLVWLILPGAVQGRQRRSGCMARTQAGHASQADSPTRL
jgi:hypothetical protein